MAGPIFSLGTSTDDAYMHALKLSPITVKPLIPKKNASERAIMLITVFFHLQLIK